MADGRHGSRQPGTLSAAATAQVPTRGEQARGKARTGQGAEAYCKTQASEQQQAAKHLAAGIYKFFFFGFFPFNLNFVICNFFKFRYKIL